MLRIIKITQSKVAAEKLAQQLEEARKTKEIIDQVLKPDQQQSFISIETKEKMLNVFNLFQSHESFYNRRAV